MRMKYLISLIVPFLLVVCASSYAQTEERGLAAVYYSNPDFSGTSVSRIDPALNFSWNESPAPGIEREFWSAIWTGSLQVPINQTYTFTTNSDDGIQLIIDGNQIINDWTGHPPTIDSGSIQLAEGSHQIEVRFYNGHGNATLQLFWQAATTPYQLVPSSVLSPVLPPALIGSGTGLFAQYFPSSLSQGFPSERLEDGINFDWGSAGPGSGFSGELFSAYWRGWIEPQYSEVYTFYADADDVLWITLDGTPLLGDAKYRQVGEVSSSVYLIAGHKYEFQAGYRQLGGLAHAKLSWSCPLTAKQIIPTSQLYPWSPATAAQCEVVSQESTFVSPGWLEVVTASRDAQVLAVAVGGTIPGVRESGSRTYFTNAVGSSPGIQLIPGRNVVSVTSSVGSVTAGVQADINWEAYDLIHQPYGSNGHLSARLNDTMLLSAGGQVEAATINVVAPSGTITTLAGAPSESFRYTFLEVGTHIITAHTAGEVAGTLIVHVLSCALQAPIACEVGFQRNKTIVITGSDEHSSLWVGSSDSGNLQAGVAEMQGADTHLHIRALSLTQAQLQVRISDANGPLLSGANVDPFIMHVNAETSIDVVKKLSDGSLLTQGRLTMEPWLGNLDVKLQIFTGGSQFVDGGLSLDTTTNAFRRFKANGLYDYQIIRSPQPGSAMCHHTSIYQGSDIVGYH